MENCLSSVNLSLGMSEAPGVDGRGPFSGLYLRVLVPLSPGQLETNCTVTFGCHIANSAQCFGEINSWFKGKKRKHPFGCDSVASF